MKKTILLLGAVGVLMMTGCADEGITTDYGEWVAIRIQYGWNN